MTRVVVLLSFTLTAVVIAIGCGRSTKPSETAETSKAEAPAAANAKHEHAENRVEVAADMRRDLRITTLKIEPRSGIEAANLLGEVRVDERRYAEVGAPIAARVVRLLAAPGDAVTAGQSLVTLQSGELGKARAEYASAVARLELAKRTLQRKRDLADEHITPAREVQEAEAQAAAAEADLGSARASLTALGADGAAGASMADSAQFALRSPIAGVVIDRTIATGQMVDPGKPAFRIADLARVWLVVHAFERDAVRVTEGTNATVTLPALPDRTFTGRVTFIGREVEPSSRTIPVRIELENPDKLFRPGMSASASLPIGTAVTALLVPVAAVQRVEDRWCVFVPHDASSFEVRPIGRGREFGGQIEVLSGLKTGESVVVEGAFLLKAEAEKAKREH